MTKNNKFYIILKRFFTFHNLTGGDISFLAYRNCAAGSDILLDARDCCNKEYPCNEGEGSCNYDYDCKGGLVCGMNNCDPQKFPSKGTRCCEKGNLVIQAGSKPYMRSFDQYETLTLHKN